MGSSEQGIDFPVSEVGFAMQEGGGNSPDPWESANPATTQQHATADSRLLADGRQDDIRDSLVPCGLTRATPNRQVRLEVQQEPSQ